MIMRCTILYVIYHRLCDGTIYSNIYFVCVFYRCAVNLIEAADGGTSNVYRKFPREQLMWKQSKKNISGHSSIVIVLQMHEYEKWVITMNNSHHFGFPLLYSLHAHFFLSFSSLECTERPQHRSRSIEIAPKMCSIDSHGSLPFQLYINILFARYFLFELFLYEHCYEWVCVSVVFRSHSFFCRCINCGKKQRAFCVCVCMCDSYCHFG